MEFAANGSKNLPLTAAMLLLKMALASWILMVVIGQLAISLNAIIFIKTWSVWNTKVKLVIK